MGFLGEDRIFFTLFTLIVNQLVEINLAQAWCAGKLFKKYNSRISVILAK